MTFESPRRKRRLLPWLGAGILVGAGAALALAALPGGSPDYRDPITLAAAVKAAEGGAAASCARIPAAGYLCYVGRDDGTSAAYQVIVSADGHSWSLRH
jgi:hypothetical protein